MLHQRAADRYLARNSQQSPCSKPVLLHVRGSLAYGGGKSARMKATYHWLESKSFLNLSVCVHFIPAVIESMKANYSKTMVETRLRLLMGAALLIGRSPLPVFTWIYATILERDSYVGLKILQGGRKSTWRHWQLQGHPTSYIVTFSNVRILITTAVMSLTTSSKAKIAYEVSSPREENNSCTRCTSQKNG